MYFSVVQPENRTPDAKSPNPSGATVKFPLDSGIDANDTNTTFVTNVL